ncbi:polyphosphate kinase 1 [Arcicella aquatica]|uniref:Polyphosphate kinase n=1 Tax=Arcicella aquatica TaxID=217141 RepID=A0ABU5QM80_9BACT|nr:polyphosphate kinase 1 [Arcicella aquatica]MEA5258177.1 polyphosphate kinase 1 [Arcicella aquatica]
MQDFTFFDRDISWLYFNERVLIEAQRNEVPLLERIKFLSIYSSNLDEFYRVRVPALMALKKLSEKDELDDAGKNKEVLNQIKEIVNRQLQSFGKTLSEQILPALKGNNIHLVYNEPIPTTILDATREYFFTQVLAFLQPISLLKSDKSFFPENNKLYALAVLSSEKHPEEQIQIINIPSNDLPRFHSIVKDKIQYIVFLEDIIKEHLHLVFKKSTITGFYTFKTTRDADLTLEDDYKGDLVEKLEKQIAKRDLGFATRFLYDAKVPKNHLDTLTEYLNLKKQSIIEGGSYHNLKDFFSIPIHHATLKYDNWLAIPHQIAEDKTLFDEISQGDMIFHAPYQSYDTVLRFFNEAAINPNVEEIYVTLYRVASDSRIVNALISAAKNGKKVTVLVELKARFDEENNIKWAKRMKAEGVKIIYSVPSLKVHAKIALIKKKMGKKTYYFGLLATGNLNESTARFYTDHILLTAHQEMLQEMELVFRFLSKKKRKPNISDISNFKHLLVAQFNLQHKFIALIDREINNAKNGLPASITLKMNNLEERVLISKLYEASNAGVKINLIIRGICCLIPGIVGMSEHISVRRIIDKYLEHGRVFIFHNQGNKEVYMGSSDWMDRNIYRRIEVCFPIYNETIKQEILQIIDLQLRDTIQAVAIDDSSNNVFFPKDETALRLRSQAEIYRLLSK